MAYNVETTVPAGWVPVGYARYGTLSSAKALTDAPTAGTALGSLAITPYHAIISVETQPIRYRLDGTAPTSSEGHIVKADQRFYVENSYETLKAFKMIETTASASVTVDYYVS